MNMRAIALPFWGRVLLLAGVVGVVIGAGLLAYRFVGRPELLTLAVGSLDGEPGKTATAIAGYSATAKGAIRLNVETFGSAVEAGKAFAAGKTDLAVVRADVGDLSEARSVAILAKGVVMLIAPPGSQISGIADLRDRTVGVVGGEVNRKLVDALTRQYDLRDAHVTFKNLVFNDVRRAVDSKEFAALLLVVPLNDKSLSMLRGIYDGAAPVLIPIDAAGAIAETDGAYESFDIPKGTLRGAPAVPDDDVTTLRVSYYLVANKKLKGSLIAQLTQMVVAARRDLIGVQPQLAGVAAADTDPDAYIPIHPGAAAYYNGTEQSFMDRYGDDIFLAPMLLGGLASVMATAWRFLGIRLPDQREATLDVLTTLPQRIRRAGDETELDALEEEADAMIGSQLAKALRGEDGTLDAPTLMAAAQRLDNLIHHRRMVLVSAAQSGVRKVGRV